MSDDPLDLRGLLGKTAGDFPDLPDLPAKKTFYGKIMGIGADKSSQKGTPLFKLPVRLTDPGKDVTEKDLAAMKEAGFSLADYDVWGEYYLTTNAMKMFRRFLESLGFPMNVRLDEMLKLNPENLNPTEETQELFRGRDVICVTADMDDKGRVYRRLDSMAGIKRD